MEDKITLIVKAANLSVDDYQVECDMNWTVLQLKENLATSFPSKPTVLEQRLIYSGQLMLDHLDLRSVLRHPCENNSYTIHLVSSLTPKSTKNTTMNTTEPDTSGGVRRRTNVTTNSSLDNNTRQNENIGSTIYPTPPVMPDIGIPGDPVQQMAVMQQMYAQYMASYMNFMHMSGMSNFNPQPAFSFPTTPMASGYLWQNAETTSSVPDDRINNTERENQPQTTTPQPEAQPQPEQPRPQPNPPQPAIRINAQDEEEEGRDWLDYIYYAFRMVGILLFVYVYSTFLRFVMVICAGWAIYLYQARRRAEAVAPQRQPEERVVPPEPPANEDDRNNNIQNNNNNNDVPADVLNEQNANENNADNEPGVENPIVAQRPSFLAVSWTFLTTFFTSLIPEQQQI